MKNRLKVSVVFLFVLMLILSCLYIFYLFSLILGHSEDSSVNAKPCSHHILVLGSSEDENFLKSIYDGAKSVSSAYDSVVELYVPKNYNGEKNIQALFDYASFINPDGMIVCLPEINDDVRESFSVPETSVPMITLGQYHPNVPQVAYIGTNYSELGRKIARESVEYLSGKGRIVIINIDEEGSPNYSTLMNSLTTTFSSYQDISASVFDYDSSDKSNPYGNIKKMIIHSEVDLLVCLTTEDTIKIAQLVTEIHRDGRVGIIGFGRGEVLDTYLIKGTITELLSIDSEKIGRTAINELFEYIKNGYANNYIAADVRIRRSVVK